MANRVPLRPPDLNVYPNEHMQRCVNNRVIFLPLI